MASIYDYISGLGGRITSTKRDPNSRLGRANPRSFHNIGQAVDVAPIPGLNFQQYVQKLKDAGYEILEARDEVSNPSRHATGPHWHVAFGKQGGDPGFSPSQSRHIKTGTAMPLNPSLYPVNLGQPDPMGPMESPLPQQGIAGIIQQQPNMAAMSQPDASGRDPLAPKPGAFDKGGTGWVIAGIIADAIAGGFGGKGGFAPTYLATQEDNRQERLYREKVAAEREERMRPRVEQVGNSIGMLNPQTGEFTPTYQQPKAPDLPAEADKLAWWQSLSPQEREAALAMMDATNPIAVAGPNGTHRVPRSTGRSPVRSGVDQASGRRVVQYSDGSIEYAD